MRLERKYGPLLITPTRAKKTREDGSVACLDCGHVSRIGYMAMIRLTQWGVLG